MYILYYYILLTNNIPLTFTLAEPTVCTRVYGKKKKEKKEINKYIYLYVEVYL